MSPTDYAHQAAALAELTAATKMWRQAEALRVREASALTAAVRAAFDAGVARTDIAEVTGLSRTRIYELRDAADNARASQRLAEVLAMPDDDKEQQR